MKVTFIHYPLYYTYFIKLLLFINVKKEFVIAVWRFLKV
jgi:hypothetical protein